MTRMSSGFCEKSGERAAGSWLAMLCCSRLHMWPWMPPPALGACQWGASSDNTAAAARRDALQARTVQFPWASVEDHQSRVSVREHVGSSAAHVGQGCAGLAAQLLLG